MGKRKGGAGGGDLRMAKKQKQQHQNHMSKRQQLPQTSLYTLQDGILVLGDGDFTFSRGLVTHRGGGANLYATSFDTASQVRKKYSNANDCIAALTKAGAQVFHGIDATKLETLPASIPHLFDYIIFNFPHSGQQRVHINRVLLFDFFESARGKLAFKGEVHLTLKTKPPYSNWNVEDQAKANGFVLKERRPFRIDIFPGYNHRTTDPTAKPFEPAQCITYVYVVDRSRFPVAKPPTPVSAPASTTPDEIPTSVAAKKTPSTSNLSARQAFLDALMAPPLLPGDDKVVEVQHPPTTTKQPKKTVKSSPAQAKTVPPTQRHSGPSTKADTPSSQRPNKPPLQKATTRPSTPSLSPQVAADIRQLCVAMLQKVRARHI